MSLTRGALPRLLPALLWSLPALLIGGAWSLAAFRLMHRVGQHDAAPAVALLVALAVAATALRGALAAASRSTIKDGHCPRCHAALRTERRAADGGRPLAECSTCGYRLGEALTHIEQRT